MSRPMYVIGIWPGFAQIGVYFTSKSYNSDRKAVKDLFDTYYTDNLIIKLTPLPPPPGKKYNMRIYIVSVLAKLLIKISFITVLWNSVRMPTRPCTWLEEEEDFRVPLGLISSDVMVWSLRITDQSYQSVFNNLLFSSGPVCRWCVIS